MMVHVLRFSLWRVPPRVVPRRPCRPRRRLRSTPLPWEFGFQLNERYLKWNESAQAQLVKRVVQDKLQLTNNELQMRLDELTVILPDLTERLSTLTVPLLAKLLDNPRKIADRVVFLKTRLPNFNLGDAVRRYPELVACYTTSELQRYVVRLQESLDGDALRVGELLTKEPRCLKIDVNAALKEVERLMPGCPDPLEQFMRDPGQFLSMEQMGLEATN